MKAPACMPPEAGFGLYLVLTQPRTSYAVCAEAAVAAGVRYLQLRMKHAARAAIVAEARVIRGITADSSTRFVVNAPRSSTSARRIRRSTRFGRAFRNSG